MRPGLILFDDEVADRWEPFALTRPVGELMFGALTLRERAERVFDSPCLGHIAAEHLRTFEEPGARPVLDPAQLPTDRDLLFLSSRAVPAWPGEPRHTAALGSGLTAASGADARLIRIGGEVGGWYAPAGSEHPPAELLRTGSLPQKDHPIEDLPGQQLQHVWELITRGPEQIGRDIIALFSDRAEPDTPSGVYRLGSAPLVLGEGVSVEPGVVLDLREGPIWLDDHVAVRAFTRLAGPAYIGSSSTVLGGSLTSAAVGPHCKVRGEVEEAVMLGYANKAHDGFLGHAYLGRWVNLGALTTNSDLKNNYGQVRLETAEGPVDTGEIKLGCLLGDHVKTAIGTFLNTGTIIGAGSNIFGAASPPRRTLPFSWGTSEPPREYDLTRFLATTETIMARRSVTLSPGQRDLLRQAWQRGRRPA